MVGSSRRRGQLTERRAERRNLGTRSILRPATANQRPERTQPANQRPGPEVRDQ